MNIEIRPATNEDIINFYGKPLPYSARAWYVEADGKPGSISGIYYTNKVAVAFSDIHEDFIDGKETSAPKKAVWRATLGVFENMKSLGIPMIAFEDDRFKSRKFLERLGFEYVEGNMYQWQLYRQ